MSVEAMKEEDLMRRLNAAQAGSCNCGAKTPEPKYHILNCRYAAIALAEAALTAALSRQKELEQALEERVRELEDIKAEAACTKEYAESEGLKGGILPSSVHIKCDSIISMANDAIRRARSVYEGQ